MNGYEAMRTLRGNPLMSAVPIIAITSFAMVGDREKAIEAGADEYLSKPIDTRQFRELVKSRLKE
jgi:CheY-like chemotaxis protein